MQKIKISAVSYLNTLPFLYGIKHSAELKQHIFHQDIPSECARKLIDNEVDIALIPVAAIPHVKEPVFISDYCLGAINKVKTVLLLSEVPIDKIDTILLDYQSRTSVKLIKVLVAKHWKVSPKWIDAPKGFEDNIKNKVAGVVIGDRAFKMASKFEFSYDLSEEWYKMTTLPFVFATWVANKPIENEFITRFNKALKFGLNNIDQVVKEFYISNPGSSIDLKQYLTQNINFLMDDKKRESMKLFFEYLLELGVFTNNEPVKKVISLI